MGFFEWMAIRDLRRRNDALLATSRARRRANATQTQRLREMEAELGRVSLLAFALAELCLDKGVVSIEELDSRLKDLDATDGNADGRLAPGRRLPGETSVEPPPALVTAPSKARVRAIRRNRR